MGEVGGDSAETLDQGMWAGDSDDEEDQPPEGEETGKNMSTHHLL